MLPGGQLRVLVQGLPGSQRPERDGCCLEMIHRNGLGSEIGRGHGDVLGRGAGAVEADQAPDLVSGSPAAGPVAYRRHHAGQVVAGDGGQFSGQVSSWAVTAVPRTSTSNSPGPGSGTGTLWLARLAGSELDARIARMTRPGRTGSG